MKRLKTLKKRVAYILELIPATRYDDNLLLTTYWKLFDNIISVNDIVRATKAESIMRTRRLVMNDHGLKNYIKNLRRTKSMAKEELIITVAKDGGITMEVKGVAGKSCMETTQEIEVALGKVDSKEKTADYYKPDPDRKVYETR